MLARKYRCLAEKAKQPLHTSLLALVIAMSNVGVEPLYAAQNLSPVGQGFTVTAADLAFILKQIKIAEAHVAAANLNPATDPDNCQALIGEGPNQLQSPLLSFGLRTVDGSCNNLQIGQEKFGAADQPFPRLTTPVFNGAEPISPSFPVGPPGPTSYAQTIGSVVDSQPRVISNLIVDQTSTNPAAVFVAGNPARTQGAEGVVPCTTEPTAPGAGDGLPLGCVPAHETLFIPNVTTDVGLSPPFNSLFTIFGQFFDHGLDKITNGGNGTVFVPLKDDDPLVAGPDHDFGTDCDTTTPSSGCADNLPPQLRFMALTRGHIIPGADGFRNAPNTDSPFVDQSQTYTSHASHQVFLREYKMVSGKPVTTGRFLSTADGGLANWAMIKAQAATKLGLELVDADVDNIPQIDTDQYGNFIPGSNGLPQYVTATGERVEGNLGTPATAVAADAKRIDTAFLNDIAHNAVPTCTIGTPGCPSTGVKAPDADSTAGGSLVPAQASGEYDNELLDLHYICGDGRCNENIALTAVHQVFHMEHDRLVDYFYHDDGSNIPGSVNGVLPQNPELLAEFQAVNLTPNSPNKTFTFEERLFQAARFVTEMQYQHLVFEEFARKVQPAINPFEPFAFNQTDLNSAITAEFAHAVYRFGHSMLDEDIPRINQDGSHNDIPLLDGFLNPAEFNNGGAAGHLTDREAVGALILGLSDQPGNEIDEFVTEVLRNNLLGLPLDLPSLNMARARSEGIPSLNNVRKQIHAVTNDAQLIPYANWIDFEQGMKHSVSLVNFIAAYGKHPTIVSATTLGDKRAAAELIINGGGGAPADRNDFMFSLNAWANVAGVSQTGIDDIDLWVGGLAENTNVFGGLLGSTFNYVFEKQLTDLQNGDRFYYLARTPGMNLRAELEGNSFAELVLRNTVRNDGTTIAYTLKADPFATADCKFELANLAATPQGFIDFGSIVANDPSSECNESALLIRLPDGTIKYRATNTIDPPGINGQSVYNGTNFADSFYGGNDNDTFWGGLGDDTINGGGGDDVVLGGDGDDIITDFAGFDILKGGPGNDAIDGGPNDDILMPGFGKDFTNGGANINETFASEGDDFAIAGQGTDAVFGDGGDDLEEGGDQPDLLIGDSSSLFFDDHNEPGHDVLIGQGGDDDYDMEGGDDIGISGPGVEKIAGAAGYDWEIGLGDPQPQVMDLNLNLVGVPLPVNAVRDKFNEVEALSGWKFNDTLYGDSVIPSQVAGGVVGAAGGFIGCNALDADGVARIAGLDTLVTPAMRVFDPGPIAAATASSYCGLTAEPGFAGTGTPGGVWGEGNILLGGDGSDTIEGRGGNDIIDGDKYLNVRLSVRNGSDDTNGVDTVTDGSGAEIGSTSLMETAAVTGDFGPYAAGMTLQQAVFARKVNPGNIVLTREILRPDIVAADCNVTPAANRKNCDKAVFSGPPSEYTVVAMADGSVVVTDNADATAVTVPITPTVPRNVDGIDILWNMEQISYCPVPGVVSGTCNTNVNQGGQPRFVQSIVPTASVTGNFVFGGKVINTTPALTRTVTIRNTGIANLIIPNGGVSLTGDSSFAVTGGTCLAGANLVKDTGNCTVTVSFAPTSTGAKTGSLVIAHNGAGLQTSVPLSGTGTKPIATVSLDTFNFGGVQTGIAVALAPVQVITLNNNTGGDGALTVTNVTLTGGAGFSKSGTCTTVSVGQSCPITIKFRPTTGGSQTATLTFTDNSNGVAGSTQSVILEGNGTITAVNDNFAVTAGGVNGTQNIGNANVLNVRLNDLPTTGTLSIVPGTTIVNNGGATAEAVITGTPTTQIVTWRLTATGGDFASRQAARAGTYTVTYQLTNGTATSTATYTLTVF
ncbi:MAG: choice-of-anchor D domain-containing protein [Methylococcaceae bacterium]|nr:choice-of-anchor D domain-containing protein [Methylococcaceae bacterium]